MSKRMLLAAATTLGIAAYAAIKSSRAGYETAPYSVILADGPFEVRRYPALVLAETPMQQGADGSFMRLFRFITGSNAAHAKIAMTTPVLMTPAAQGRAMAFVLPASTALDEVPGPADPTVAVREVAARTVATHRFGGGPSAKNEAAARDRLGAWMRARGMDASGEAWFAYYDPPWTPAFLRRSEVLLAVAEASGP